MISVSRRQFWLGLAVLIAVIGIGVGAYFVGHSSGEDLDVARAQGAQQGQTEGAAKGAAEGFTAGRRAGRRAAFGNAYKQSYREAYRKAYEDAGLDPPDDISVPKLGEQQ
jgi:hypothetical protein